MSITEFEFLDIPSGVIAGTHAHLAAAGRQGVEGLVLWVGTIAEDVFKVAEFIVPKQYGQRGDHGLLVSVPPEELHKINLWLYKSGYRLIAQVHSHPTEAYHSEVDDRFAIATRLGSYSLVVPDFAVRPFSLSDCAVYRLTKPPLWRFSRSPKWKRMKTGEVCHRIRVVP